MTVHNNNNNTPSSQTDRIFAIFSLEGQGNQKIVLSQALSHNAFIFNAISNITNNISKDKPTRWRQENDLVLHLSALKYSNSENPDFTALGKIIEEVAKVQKARTESLFPHWTQPLEQLKALINPQNATAKSALDDLEYKNKHIEDDTLAHIHIETLIGESNYAGDHVINIIQYLHNFLENYHPPFETSDGFQNFKLAIARQYDFLRELGDDPSFEHFQATYLKYVSMLTKENDLLLIESAWTAESGSHSEQLLLIAKGNDKFDVLRFNLGADVREWHFYPNPKYVQSYFKKGNVSKASLTSEYYLRTQHEMTLAENPLTKKPANYSDDDAYGTIVLKLDGQVSHAHDPKNILPVQTGPICTWASLKAATNYFIGYDNFARLSFDIAFHSLCTSYQSHKDTPLLRESTVMMMHHSGVSLAQVAADSYRNGVITAEELEKTHATLYAYFLFLNAQEVALQNTLKVENYPHDDKDYRTSMVHIVAYEDQTATLPTINLPGQMESVKAEDLSSPTALIYKLGGIHQYLLNYQETKHIPNRQYIVWQNVANTFRALPLPNENVNGIDFWGQFNEVEAKQMIVLLFNLADLGKEIYYNTQAPPVLLNQISLYLFLSLTIVQKLSANISDLAAMQGELPLRYFFENFLYEVHTPTTTGHCTYFNPRDRKIRSLLLQAYHSVPHSSKNLFIVSNDTNRDGPPALCLDIPMAKKQFDEWLVSDQAPAEAPILFNYLMDPKVRNALLKEHPELKNKSDQRLFVALLCTHESGILPSHFFAYRNLALSLRTMTCMLYVKPLEDNDPNYDSDNEATEDPIKSHFEIEESDMSVSIRMNYQTGVTEDDEGEDKDICALNFDSQKFTAYSHGYQRLYNAIRSSDSFTDTGVLTQKFVEFLKLERINLPLDTARDLLDLLSLSNMDNGRRHPETQIIKTLSYFSIHPELLNKDVMRDYLSLLLLENDYLEMALRSYPFIAQLLANFFEEGIVNAFQQGDFPKLTHFLSLARTVEDIINFEFKRPIVTFPNYYNWIMKTLPLSTAKSNAIETELYKLVLSEFCRNAGLRQYAHAQKEAILAYFLSKAINTEAFISEFNLSNYAENELKGVYKVLEPYIYSILSTPESAQGFCNEILNRLHHSNMKYEWNLSAYPLCISSDGKYCINFLSGECLVDGRTTVLLDRTFLHSSTIRKIFPTPPSQASKDLRGDLHITTDQASIIFTANDLYYHLLPDNTHAMHVNFPQCKILTPLESSASEGSVWVQKRVNGTLEITLRDRNFKKTHLIYAHEESNIKQKNYVIDTVFKVLPNNELLEWVKQDIPDHPFRQSLPKGLFLQSILWKDSKGQFVQLDIPFIKQFFTVKPFENGFIAFSEQFKGYHLSNNVLLRHTGMLPFALVIENDKRQKKALMPIGKINFPSSKGAFIRSYSFMEPNWAHLDEAPKQLYYSYSVDPVKGITSKERENKLYLAYHLLAHKNYSLAYDLLMNSIPSLIPYKEEELEVLKDIGKLYFSSQDTTQQACTISLLAYSLYCKKIESSKILPDNLSHLKRLYYSYANQYYLAPVYTIPNDLVEFIKSFNLFGSSFFPTLMTAPLASGSSLNAGTPFKRMGLYSSILSAVGTLSNPGNLNLSHSEFDDWCNKTKHELPANRLISRPGAYLLSNFLFFYDKALRIDNELDADIHFIQNEDDYPKFHLLLLRVVSFYPEKFPAREVLEAILQRKDWPAFNHLILAPFHERVGPNQEFYPFKAYQRDEAQTVQDPAMQIESLAPASSSSSSASGEITTGGLKRKISALEETPSSESKLRKTESVLPEVQWKPFFSEKELKKFFKEEIKTEDSLSAEQLQDALESVDVNIVSGESSRLKLEIEDYWTSPDRTTPWNLLDPEKLISTTNENIVPKTIQDKEDLSATTIAGKGIAGEVAIIKAELKKHYDAAFEQLIWDIENLPDDLKHTFELGIDKQALSYHTPTMEELTLFIARNNSKHFKSLPPAVLKHEEKLRRQIIEVQSQYVRIQQLERAQTHLADLQSLKEKGVDTKDIAYRHSSESLYYELTRLPPYNPHRYPHLLCMEILDNKGLYAWQHTDIDKILNPLPGKENIVIQKNMGAGKTQVYLRILALMLAQNGNTPFIVVHSSQEGSVAKEMERGLYHQEAFTFEFSRQTQSAEKLQTIKDLLETASDVEGYFFVTDTTLYELRQCYKETLVQYLSQSPPHPQTVERLRLFIEIDRFIHKKCPAIWDEFDLHSNCRFENIFTTGDPVTLPEDYSNLVADIFESIFTDPELMATFKTKAYTEDEYHTVIKEKLVNNFLKANPLLKVLVKDLMTEEQLRLFFMADSATEKLIKGFPLEIRSLLHIAHEEFNNLFPLTVSKQHNVDYMSSNDLNKIFPVPGLACKVPNPTSDFGFIFALLNYIIHSLFAEGVTVRLMEQLIQRMQIDARLQLEHDPALRIDMTKGYQDYQELCGKDMKVPFFSINSTHIKEIIASVPKDAKFLCSFAKKFIFPLVTYNPKKIVSTPYTLKAMFPRVIGPTATPWNHATYDESFQIDFDRTVEPLTAGLLIKNSQVIEIEDIVDDENGPENTIKALAAIAHTHGIPFDDLIDCGAFIKVEHNIEGARLLLKYLPPHKKGVVFFHNNVEAVLERGNPDPIPLEKCILPLNERHIFYDDWHTTGANIEADPLSCGYLTFDKTSKRKLMQSFGRKRQRHLKQKVIIVLKQSQGAYVRSLLKLPPDTAILPKHILKVSQFITETEINEQLVSSAQSKLDHVIEEKIFTGIRESTLDPLPLLQESAKPLEAILTQKVKIRPTKTMGPIHQEIERTEYFDKCIGKLIKKASPLAQNSLFAITVEELKEDLDDTLSHCIVPQPIPRNHFSKAQQLVQQQTQQQSQAQVRQEVASNPFDSNYTSFYIPHINWNTRGLPGMDNFFISVPYDKASDPELNNVPILHLPNLMEMHQHLAPYANAFANIELSANFTPNYGILFEKNQLTAKCAVLVYNRALKGTRLILINEADRGFLFEQIKKERYYAASKKVTLPNAVLLFDFGLGVFQANYADNVILAPAHFEKQILIARFMYGEMHYSKRSLEIIKDWLIDNDPIKMERFFYQHILHGKDKLRDRYPGTPLHKLFQSLIDLNKDSKK